VIVGGRVRVVGIGAGGHARILTELLEQIDDYELIGFTDADHGRWGTSLAGYPVLGGDEELPALRVKGVAAAFIGVGAVSSAGTRLRAKLFRQAISLGFTLPVLVHSRAIVSPSATLGPGSVVLAGAVLSAGVRLGSNVTLYPGVVVEHDSIVGDHVHLSPGAQLAGGVQVGEGAFIGIGASVIQEVRIGMWATVGAGAVVLRDVPDAAVVVGVPARLLPQENSGFRALDTV
jgi:sugar O-acyltransferase (sialic acid O-acetyltransferase NeuD family)